VRGGSRRCFRRRGRCAGDRDGFAAGVAGTSWPTRVVDPDCRPAGLSAGAERAVRERNLLAGTPWRGREVRMYERFAAVFPGDAPLGARRTAGRPCRWRRPTSPCAGAMARCCRVVRVVVSRSRGQPYRDGFGHSVAWHGRLGWPRDLPTAIVSLVSLAAVRRSRLRTDGWRPLPASAGPGPGDLLVLGGSCPAPCSTRCPRFSGPGLGSA